jgi:hypothetical protein
VPGGPPLTGIVRQQKWRVVVLAEFSSRLAARTWVLVVVIVGVPVLYPVLATGVNLLPRTWLATVTQIFPVFAILHLLAFALVICVVVVGLGRQRFHDLGLRPALFWPGVMVAVAVWCVAQIVIVAIVLVTSGGLAVHSAWREKGGTLLVTFAGNLIGTAVFEEVTYRGFLLPELYQRLRRPDRRIDRWRLVLALVVGGVCFAVAHLPVFLIQQRPPQVIAAVAVMLTLAGVFGGVLYLRTGNLFTVIGIHALYNSPLPVVECSPTVASGVILVLGVLLAVVGHSLVWQSRPNQALQQTEAACRPSRIRS